MICCRQVFSEAIASIGTRLSTLLSEPESNVPLMRKACFIASVVKLSSRTPECPSRDPRKLLLTDFIGFSSSGDPSCRHENSAHDGGLAVPKLGSFRKAQSGDLGADSRVTTAARGVQAQVEEAAAEKQGPSILVVALKGLERLEI